MKTSFKKLPLLLLLALPTAVQAQFTYTTNADNTITITRYTGPGGDVTIPGTINGLLVATIGDSVFSQCTSLTSVTIPNSVTSIGRSAFLYCRSLTSVVIPNSVASIGNAAFAYCSRLTSVRIPNSVTNIWYDAFTYCNSLTAITVDASNPVYSSLDGVLLNRSQTTIIEYPPGKTGSYTIPNGVTNIGGGAFYVCGGLTSLTIPNSVISIGSGAFHACYSLTTVMIGNSVASIGDLAFTACDWLRAVYFQGNAPSLGLSVFGWDTATVYYLPGTTGWGATFGGCPTALWFLPNPQILTSGPGFGVQTNQFGFIISWAMNIPVVVEASTNLANPAWSPLATNTLTSGSSYFTDPQWTDYPARFYRLRSP